ncbi:MAG: N-acetyl sugar amidotransferase [Flavobacteriales bacterium]
MKEFKQCIKCVMDTSDPAISFNEFGVCSHCLNYEQSYKRMNLDNQEYVHQKFNYLISEIKNSNKGNNKFDCVLGISGGVDSSYLAYLCNKYELSPLLVHFDNGWNTEQSVSNIEKIVKKYNFELVTYVMDWEAFRDIQRAYFKASVIDIEVPTDQFIFASLNKIAAKYNIKYILSGYNFSSEGIMPHTWMYPYKFDLVNLKNIHRKFGNLKKLERLPKFGLYQQHYYYNFKGISTVKLLNYVDYNKMEAKKLLQEELEWKDYGEKHYESLFTRFYQGFILPVKFGIDKRKAHLSTLINSNQLSKLQAIEILKQPPYDSKLQEEDKIYVSKKLGFNETEFDEILKLPVIPHAFYGSEMIGWNRFLFNCYRFSVYPLVKILRLLKILKTPISS